MSLNTNLPGRLRNTNLPASQVLLALFEAVVNGIHAIDAAAAGQRGEIVVEVIRAPQGAFPFDRSSSSRAEPVVGFVVSDDGEGFHDENMDAFRTLDTTHKASLGCRGVGRLLWLKAFRRVTVESVFLGPANERVPAVPIRP